jgi:hypothetical protein
VFLKNHSALLVEISTSSSVARARRISEKHRFEVKFDIDYESGFFTTFDSTGMDDEQLIKSHEESGCNRRGKTDVSEREDDERILEK